MSKRSCFSSLDIQIDGDVQATYENIEIVAGIADGIEAIGSNMQTVIEATTDPLKTSILNAETNATNAQTSANNALVSEQNAKNSENHTAILEQIVVEKEALVNPHYNSIDTVANNIGNVNTVAVNIIDVNAFANVYYGSNATDPTKRKNGSALQVGDLYYNTANKEMRAYNGLGWDKAYVTLAGALIASSNLSDLTDTATALVNLGLDKVDNTADLDKPISTATQNALNLKLNSSAYTANDVLTKIKTVDGSGSDLDADLLDGQEGSYYQPASTAITTSNIGRQFVDNATKWNGSSQTTSTAAPSGGVDGDIWFQY